jgi:hypothetical protein
MKRFLLAALLAAVASVSSRAAPAATPKLAGTGEIAYFSDYLWRGQELAEDSIQPSVSVTYGENFQLGLWGSYGLKDGPNGKYSETDLLGSYTFSQEKFSLSVGGTLYRITDLIDPETGDRFEYYFESLVTLALRVRFNPTITFYREFGRLNTNYVEGSVSESVELAKDFRLTFRPYGGAFERGNHYYGAEISANLDLPNNAYVRAAVNLVKNNYTGTKHDNINFGIATGLRW